MDYQVSARKYRPARFDEVVGQKHVVQTLMNAITTGRIAHAFLFSGTRGVGKTTVARILAKALNCEQGPTGTPCNQCPNCLEIAQGTSIDVVEIDGASNTSVDDVREVRENIKFAPFRGRYRVYIIDEVHMLSTSAFNALLKTLEEPPSHVVFVFATTELHKIPATILSRCQHYNFRRITRAEIVQRLRSVAEGEEVEIEDRSLMALARASEGSMRDGLSMLDQAVAFAGKSVRHADLETLLGSVPQEHVQAMFSAIVAQDSAAALRVIAELLDQGHDLRAYCGDLVEGVRNVLVAAVVPSQEHLSGLMEVSKDELQHIRAIAESFTAGQLQELFKVFSHAEDGLRVSAHPRFVLEAAVVRATRIRQSESPASSDAPRPERKTASSPRRDAASSTRSLAQEGSLPSERVAATRAASSPAAPQATPQPSDGQPPAVKDAPTGTSGSTRGLARKPAEDSSALAQASSVSAPGSATEPESPGSEMSPVVPPQDSTDLEERNTENQGPALKLNWDDIVERVSTTHPSIGPFLERGLLVQAEGECIMIGYGKADTVARGLMEREDNLRTLGDLCAELAGRPVRVRIVELKDSHRAGVTRAQARAAEAQEKKLALLDQARSHPVVKQALDMFGGDIVEVRQASSQKEARE